MKRHKHNKLIFILVLLSFVISFGLMMLHLSSESHPDGEWQCSSWTEMTDVIITPFVDGNTLGLPDMHKRTCLISYENKTIACGFRTCNQESYVRKPK